MSGWSEKKWKHRSRFDVSSSARWGGWRYGTFDGGFSVRCTRTSSEGNKVSGLSWGLEPGHDTWVGR